MDVPVLKNAAAAVVSTASVTRPPIPIENVVSKRAPDSAWSAGTDASHFSLTDDACRKKL